MSNRGQFPCAYCDATTLILESRQIPNEGRRRRRECTKCHQRFTTMERVEAKSVRRTTPPDDRG